MDGLHTVIKKQVENQDKRINQLKRGVSKRNLLVRRLPEKVYKTRVYLENRITQVPETIGVKIDPKN